ncbi:MAG: DUF167 domain-containing protein [Nanoarchaeota archaeon]|nr:DUF167 domain-containing protein [Nanoarchaeota archaeon]MBU0977272.1 DUF167 domain-containing protein [Nanoarchaeota archaeon]
MILKIKVNLHSQKPSLEKIIDNEYIAYIKEPPEKGKANLELTKLLAKHFSISQTKIKIKTPTSRNKIVEILQ